MPKETMKEQFGNFSLIVGWDPEFGDMQVAVDGGMPFEFIKDDNAADGPYTGLWFTFRNADEVNQFVKNLHKAKRKAFK